VSRGGKSTPRATRKAAEFLGAKERRGVAQPVTLLRRNPRIGAAYKGGRHRHAACFAGEA